MSKNITKNLMLIFFLMLISFSQNSYAQVSGTYTIPGVEFATIKAAVDSLNLVGVGSGGVTFNVNAAHTETTTDSLVLTATGTSVNPIVFQKSGIGANPLISRIGGGYKKVTSTFGGQGDAVITLQGSDYVTFDGIDVSADSASVEYGYYIRKADSTNGCKYVTIKNSLIDMTKGTSAFVVGIYSSNNAAWSPVNSATGINIINVDGRNEYVTITGNTIQDVHIGIALRGFNHTVAPNSFQDYNFVVGASGQGNTIRNFGAGSTATTYGIYLINETNPTVSYNTINNAAGGANATGQIYGIFMSATSASVNRGGDVVMNNNNITIGISATSAVSSITIAPICSSVIVSNNIFNFGTFASTTASTIISVAQNTPVVTITGNQNSAPINKTGAGQLNCINYFGSPVNGVITIADNNFSNITLTGFSNLSGILASGSATATLQTYNNTFSNMTLGSGTVYGIQLNTALVHQVYNNTVNNLNGSGTLYGISFQGTNPSVYNNTVYALSTSSATLVGISNQGTVNTNCYKNQVYNLTSTNTAGVVTGITISGGTGNNVYNNFISDLKVPSTTSTGNALFGINASASNPTAKIGLYYNTIYLNSTGATAYKSFGIFSNTGNTSELRNNIVVNTSTGIPVAYGRSSNAFGTYSSLSDNNDFFATNIFFDGTTLYPTLEGYKTLVYPRDQASFSENPPFVNTITAPYDLHINSGIATQTEKGGRPVLSPVGISEDFDGNLRDASFSDVGADEFSGIALDLTAPIISYTPLLNTGSLINRTLVVKISDPSGVPTAAPGWPNLYWKQNDTGSWNASIPTSVAGIDYTFNFGAGVNPGDIVYYFIAAQDNATTPNVRAFPTIGAGTYTANPPAAGVPPTTPSSYIVSNVALAGDYTVGSALFKSVTGKTITFQNSTAMENGQPYYGDLFVKKAEHPEYNYPEGVEGIYLTLTAAVNDLNLRGVSAPVNFLLTDTLYTDSAYVVNITNESKPTSVNSVTFKPNTGVVSKIKGSASSGAIFKILNSYVGLDGSNSGGTDRSLTIENTSGVSPTVVWFASIGTTPIIGGSLKNCVVTNGSNLSTAYAPAVLAADSTTASFGSYVGGYFNNINIQNNRIQKSYYGITISGMAVAGNGNGLSITGNDLNSLNENSIGWWGMLITGVDGAAITNNNIGNIINGNTPGPVGVYIGSQTINTTISNNIIGPIDITSLSAPQGITINSGNANSNLIISGNTISGLRYNQAAVVMGLQLGGNTGNVLITRNKISDIKNTYVGSSAYGAYAVQLFSNLTAANITFANNFIWDVAGYGRASQDFHNGYGIQIAGGGGYNIYHNTISLTTEQTLTTGMPACINITSSVTTAGSLDIRNNIFATFQTIGTDRYAIVCKAAPTVFAYLDNNTYYTTGSNLGYINGANVANLTAWRTATGKDVNSIFADPKLVSANDLHANPNYNVLDGKGFYLSTVPQDIDGDTRNNPSDIGADEYTFIPPVDPAAFAASAFSSSQINLTWTKSVNLSDVIVAYNTTNSFGAPVNASAYVPGDTLTGGGTIIYSGSLEAYNHTGLAGGTTYYYKAWSTNGPNQYSSPGLTANATTALALPYFQDFNAALTLPSGWTGDFAVVANHGTGGSNGLTFNLYDTEPTASARSPWVGSVITNTALEFDYRIVNWSGYPGTATAIGGNTIQVQVSTDDINYTTVYTIDSSNHVTSTSFANKQVMLSAYIGSTIYVKFLGTWTSGDYYVDIDNFYIGNANLLNPGSLTASTISASQIDVAFTTNTGLNNVVIVWNTTGTFTLPAGTPPVAGDPFAGGTLLYNGVVSPVNHSGLTSSTLYYYKAFSYDGSTYSTGLSASAATYCPAVTVPLTQSFDDVTFPPLCWTRINAGSGNNWLRATTNTYAGAGTMAYGYNTTSAANAWMISQGLDLTAGTTYIVGFWQKVASATYPEKLKVTVGTLPTVAAQSTVIWDNAGGSNLANTTYMYRTAFYTPSVTGTYYFAFNVYSDADMYNLYVDEISILAQPAIDLSFKSFYQVSGLPTPENGSDFNVTMSKDSKQEGLTFVTTGPSENSSDVNNSTLVQSDYQIQLADITLKGIVENLGSNAASYSLGYSVNGIPQTPYAGPTVNTASTDTATITYTPTELGTFIVPGTIAVTGDEVAANNNAQFRMRVYPDTYSRTIYDRGDNIVNSYIGYSDSTIRVKAGVRYTAGGQIKLAGVDFIGRTEAVASGEWEVQVRAAGTTTGAPGAVLYTKVYNTSDYFASSGAYFFFAFGNDAPVIAAGSDYWITVKAPLGTLFPLGSQNTGITPGHSFIQDDPDTTGWFPVVLSSVEYAWVMRAVHVTVAPTTFQLTVNINDGWNMVSIPGLLPTNQNVITWWPGKDPAAGVFKFGTGYQAVTDAVPGTGYWMKNAGAQTYNTGDEWPAGGINFVAHDPIPAINGWNLFGGYEQSVAVGGITTTPPGLQSGSIFKYAGGYQSATTIDPGYGYWVKLTGAGSINIPAAGPMKSQSTTVSTEDFGSITITDNAGKNYTLYAVQGEADLSQFDLPPYPPQGMFDVRYSSQRFAERLSSTPQAIEMMGVQYPVKVKAEVTGIILTDESGKEIARLKAGEEVTLTTTAQKLMVSENIIPAVFSLEQNYPNPFNPSTVIEFSLPENSNVQLSIYNALGEKVAELVNSSLSAGKYNYQWNASDVATGMYIYELRTDNFVSVKKMMLLK